MRAQNVRFDINNYIVGTAISYARPGDNVDIILHRINHYSAGGGMLGGGDIGGGGGGGGEGGEREGEQAVPINPGKKPQVKNKKSKKSGGN